MVLLKSQSSSKGIKKRFWVERTAIVGEREVVPIEIGELQLQELKIIGRREMKI